MDENCPVCNTFTGGGYCSKRCHDEDYIANHEDEWNIEKSD